MKFYCESIFYQGHLKEKKNMTLIARFWNDVNRLNVDIVMM